jgi:CRISPR-associated protein Cmr1
MPRQEVTLPDALEFLESNTVTLERHYKLITPLFGGGVKAGENDPSLLIRPTSIRGHLRFWWRATRGSNEHVQATLERLGLDTEGNDLEKLRRLEGWIWGAAASKRGATETREQRIAQSRVHVQLMKVTDGEPFSPHDGFDVGNVRSEYSYVAFPLRESGASVQHQIEFGIKIIMRGSSLEIESEVNAALWAWSFFGGIGARNRRGFGAICETVRIRNTTNEPVSAFNAEKSMDWLLTQCGQHVVPGVWISNIPHLSLNTDDYRMTVQNADGLRVWRDLFQRLKEFRHQRKMIPRKLPNGTNKLMPGRNWWPEPDAIRNWTGRAANFTDAQGNIRDHSTPHYTPPVLKFPRAQFGLPIQFEFKDKRTPNGPSDPSGKNLLAGTQEHERFASPLILRPVPCQGGGYLGLALRLRGTQLPVMEIELAGLGLYPASATLTIAEAKQILNRNGQPLLVQGGTTQTDVIAAFLNTF